MPVDPLRDPGAALRAAAGSPRGPVDADRVLGRARTLRRRRTGVSAAAIAVVVAPLLLLALGQPEGLVQLGEPEHDEPVEASLTGEEPAPRTLADGAPVGEVPEAVERTFPGPVVAARRDQSLLDEPPAQCTGTRLAGSVEETAAHVGERLDTLARAAAPVAAHVGPAVATMLSVYQSVAPPPYTGAVAAVCVARHGGDAWTSQGLGVDHLYERWTGRSESLGDDPSATVWVTAFGVPAGARWAVQERPGWWLAYEVSGDGWFLAQTTAQGTAQGMGFPGTRVVFTDADGRVLADERTGSRAIPADAPFFRPHTVDARIEVGRTSQVRARLADGADPLAVCANEHGICVWLVDIDGDLAALSAAGPHPLDVPALGEIGYCPPEQRAEPDVPGGANGADREGEPRLEPGEPGEPGEPRGEGTHQFQGTSTGSVFDHRGYLLDGPAPSGLHRYEIVEEGGRIFVDLASFAYGPDVVEAETREGAPRCLAPHEPGG